MIQTTEGATSSITTMLLRISELSMQAANDTYSDTQRSLLNNEFTQLKQEINRMSKIIFGVLACKLKTSHQFSLKKR